MQESQYVFDVAEVTHRILKYLFEGLVVAIAAFFIPSKGKMEPMEVLVIAAVAMASFAILDLFAPSIGISMRQGAGLGMGFNLTNFAK